METGAISTASPAKQWGRSRFGLNPSQKSPPMAGFCNSVAGFQAPDLRCSRPKMPKVSGHSLKYSRFSETPVGDWVRSALTAGGGGVKFVKFSRRYSFPSTDAERPDPGIYPGPEARCDRLLVCVPSPRLGNELFRVAIPSHQHDAASNGQP